MERRGLGIDRGSPRAGALPDGFPPGLAQEPTDYWLPAPLPEDDDWESPARTMKEIGPLPAGAVRQRPARPAPTLAEAKAAKLAQINSETRDAVLSGFDYEINGEALHFSYDSHDQQNFADMANLCLQRQAGLAATPDVVCWKAWGRDGVQTNLTLAPAAFLKLYTAGALAHKSVALEQGDRRKLALERAQSVAAVVRV